MTCELHRMGFQCLRVMPYAYPLAWRITVAPRAVFSALNGAVIERDHGGFPTYSGASGGDLYFDWEDAKTDSAADLAEKFRLRFPEVVLRGEGRDWAYAGWLIDLLGRIEGDDLLPVVQWEHMREEPESLGYVPLWRLNAEGVYDTSAGRFPLPPQPV